MAYKYGEIFEKLGIPGMGHLGATWCELNPGGVLVLMAHQNYIQKRNGQWVYEIPREGKLPKRSSSATKSLKMITEYFEAERQIFLPVAEFSKDGGLRPDGTWEPSNFKNATGDVYRGRMLNFDPSTGYLLCAIDERFSV